MPEIKTLRKEWDSDFWGVNIFELESSEIIDGTESISCLHSCEKPFLIQNLVIEDNTNYINWLESIGFRFVENKVTLVKQIKINEFKIIPHTFKEVKLDEIHEVKNQFYTLFGKNTRYRVFSKKKINQFYLTWAINSVNGTFDDNCIGLYINDELAGFITYTIENNNMYIGLLAVFPEYQGNKYSIRMLEYLDNLAIKNGCNNIFVSTQGKNIKAINTYISNGFFINNISQWYYFMENIKGVKEND